MADDLEALADWAWQARRTAADALAIDVAGLPRALRRLLVRRAIAAGRAAAAIATPAFGPAANVESLLDALERGRRATQAGVIVTPRGTVWHVAAAPPRRTGLTLTGDGPGFPPLDRRFVPLPLTPPGLSWQGKVSPCP